MLPVNSERWIRTLRRPLTTASAALALACSLVGCASLPQGSTRDPRDHIERFNRSMYKFNTALDHGILRPVARGYVKVTPRPVRTGVSNFFGNLGYTKTIGNDIFQGHPLDFGSDVARLVVNTTVGIGGVFDPATRFGLEKHDRDFGQTLGKWGLPTGTYLILPLLGPSDVRDAFSLLPDRFMSIRVDAVAATRDEFKTASLSAMTVGESIPAPPRPNMNNRHRLTLFREPADRSRLMPAPPHTLTTPINTCSLRMFDGSNSTFGEILRSILIHIVNATLELASRYPRPRRRA